MATRRLATNTELDTFYQSKGIKSETSVPYTPQQNGKAERLNRTLLDKARPMLADANLPKFLWAEAIVTANYLRNRSPISSQDTTSYELFHGTKPDRGHHILLSEGIMRNGNQAPGCHYAVIHSR